MKHAFWLSFLLTTLVVVASCGSDEPPQFRLSNAAANVADVQIKSSDGNTVNINGVAVGVTTAFQTTAAGRIDLTANVKNDPTPAIATFTADNGRSYTINISGSPPRLTVTSP
jgi:hypothetical protein